MRRYLAVYLLVLAGLLVTMLVPAKLVLAYLDRMGEYGSAEAATQQLASLPNRCLFGSAVRQNNFAYKLALFDAVRPDVVAVGSSRVMQFRQDMFKERFLNLGGAFETLWEGEAFIDKLLERHVPKLVLLGIDVWWFNPSYRGNRKGFFIVKEDASPSPVSKMILAGNWLRQGKIGWREIADPSWVGGRRDCHMGIQARKTLQGFAPDGSYVYAGYATGIVASPDVGFRDTLSRIADGSRRFETSHILSEDALQRFLRLVATLEQRGVSVVLFFPPFAEPVNEAMREKGGDGYGYIGKLREALEKAGLEVADFQNTAGLGANDCEFIDGFHGGDVVYARILKALAMRGPLSAWVDPVGIDRYLANAGRAMARDDRVTERPEVDFLKLSCTKPAGVSAVIGATGH